MATSSSAALQSSSSSSSSLPIDDFEAMLGAPMDLSNYTTGLTHTSNGGNGSGSGGGEGGYGLAGKREREEGGVDRGKGGAKKRPKVVIKMDED